VPTGLLVLLIMPVLMFGAVLGFQWWWDRPRRRSGDPPRHVIDLHIAGLEQELDDCEREGGGEESRRTIERDLAGWQAIRRRSGVIGWLRSLSVWP